MNLKTLNDSLDRIPIKDLNKLKNIINSRKNILILGNGGSNAISSHIAEDYTKALGKKAISFSDAARLTCYINDYGMEQAYVKFIEHFAENDTLVILISSSGNSKNIVNCAEFCKGKHDFVILSGFEENNKLNQYKNQALINFWIDSQDYGIVDITHLSI